MKKLIISFSLLLLIIASFGQPNRNKNGFYEETDKAIKNKFYNWEERVQITPKSILKSNADIWYYKKTTPKDGYVNLKNGKYIEGKLSWKKVYNKASFVKITVEGGGKKPDPKGVSYYEIMITTDDGRIQNFKKSDLKNIGLFYSITDYAENAFLPGLIYHINGDIKEGYVRTIWYKSPYESLKYYGKIYYSANKTDQVELYHSDEVSKVIVQNADGETTSYYHLEDWLVDVEEYKESFSSLASNNKFESFKPGVVYMQNGEVLKGKIALDKGKKKENAFYISENETTLKDLRAEGVGCIKVLGEDGEETYIPQHGGLKPYDELMKKWTKKNEIQNGKIVFNNGEELKGRLVLGLDQSNVVKSYRNIQTLYVIPENSSGFVQVFNATNDINHSEVADKKGKLKLVPLNGIFVDYNDLVKALENTNSKTPTENLHQGEIKFTDGSTKKGKISATLYQMNFIGKENNLEQFSAIATDKIEYYTQVIEGEERMFVPMRRRPNILGADHLFVEIMDHNKKYSYYENPMATNVRKALTNFVRSQVDQLSNEISNDLANLAAREAAESTYKETGNLGSSSLAANKAYNKTIAETQGIINADGESLYFEEWIIVNNQTKEEVMVFAKNDKEVLTKLLNTCSKTAQLSERERNALKKMKNLNAAIQFLNSCDE